MIRSVQVAMMIATVLLFVGCKRQHLDTTYGVSTGNGGDGINGFGALRRGFENNGWRTKTVRRLDHRAESLDAIVWTPSSHRGKPIDTITWLQDWLADAPRTLIYVLPDEGRESDYWQQTQSLASAGQQMEYQRRYARAAASAMNGPFFPEDTNNIRIAPLWFQADMRIGDFPRWQILPHGTAPLLNSTQPHYGPGDWLDIWDNSDYKIDDEEIHQQTLRQDAHGIPLVVRLSSPASDDESAAGQSPLDALDIDQFDDEYWYDSLQTIRNRRQTIGYGIGDSQIIVVSSGALISNLGLLDPAGRDIANVLLLQADQKSANPQRTIGFLLTGGEGATVNESSDGSASANMTEHLTVWPLSVVTLHLAFLGLLACLIMLPIFGRPRSLPRRISSDFTEHLRAVGSLLSRTASARFAQQRINDYQRIVRGETTAATSQPEPLLSKENKQQ